MNCNLYSLRPISSFDLKNSLPICSLPFPGNRWLVSLWTATPHKQPPLDYTELQDIQIVDQQQVVYHHPPATPVPQLEYLELKKRESDI